LKVDADTALREFHDLNYDYRRGPAQKLESFLEEYFAPVGSDVEMVVPVDWMEAGKHVKRQLWSGIDLLLGKIKNRGLAQWTVDLHSKWPQLTRKVSRTFTALPPTPLQVQLLPTVQPYAFLLPDFGGCSAKSRTPFAHPSSSPLRRSRSRAQPIPRAALLGELLHHPRPAHIRHARHRQRH
ncbi:hypothetical protein RvY_02579-2, partial [Ramazzottius varieornatus]